MVGTMKVEQQKKWKVQKAEQRKIIKINIEELIRTIMTIVPLKFLRKPDQKKLHVTTGDYGGHELDLNYPYSEIKNGNIGEIRVGGISIGLMYEGDFEAKNGRIRCLESDKLLHYLESVASCLLLIVRPELPEFLRTLRVTVLRGAATLSHTDSFRGVTKNYLLIQDDGLCGWKRGALVLDLFPLFRCSVVMYEDSFFIPMKISQASNTLTMIGFGDRAIAPSTKETSSATWYQFDFSVAKKLEAYGDLPFAVIGVKKGCLEVIQLDAPLKLYVSFVGLIHFRGLYFPPSHFLLLLPILDETANF
jgi:hypothetical protein